MFRPAIKLLVASAIAFSVASFNASAQTSAAFDGKKFFDELSTRGVTMPVGFDRDKFFADLSTRGVNHSAPIDSKKFFQELSSKGVSMPPMVDMTK